MAPASQSWALYLSPDDLPPMAFGAVPLGGSLSCSAGPGQAEKRMMLRCKLFSAWAVDTTRNLSEMLTMVVHKAIPETTRGLDLSGFELVKY